MERVDAAQAAVRGRAVSAVTTAHAYHEHAVRGMPRWLVSQAKVTRAAAAAHKAWGGCTYGPAQRRLAQEPRAGKARRARQSHPRDL